MKRVVVLSVALSSILFAQSNSKELIAELEKLPLLNSKHIELRKAEKLYNDWYHIEAVNNGRKLEFFTDKNIIVMGQGFDLKDGKQLKFEVDVKKFVKASAFTVGKGSDEYFIFTDPECPYCKQLDELLPLFYDKAKFHIFFYPLDFHLAAEGMSRYILSQPREKRETAARDMMSKKQTLPNILKKTDKHNGKMYSILLDSVEKGDSSKFGNYVEALKIAFNLKDETQISDFLKGRVSKQYKNDNIDKEFNEAMQIGETEFNVTGTPAIFDKELNPLQGSYMELAAKYNIVNLDVIKQIAQSEYVITAGEGKEPLYIFTSTKCPHCINEFKDNKKIEALYKKYKVHYILMTTGNSQKALEEMVYLFSIKDKAKRLSEFEGFMKGTVSLPADFKMPEQSSPILQKIGMEYFGLLRNTFINSTPTAIDKDGNRINP